MHGGDRSVQPVGHVEHPVAVGGELGGRRGWVDQRVSLDHLVVQRRAVDVLLDEERVLPVAAQLVHQGHAVETGEAHEVAVLARQAADGVDTVGVQAGMRTRLLDDDPLPRRSSDPHVDAAAVGEVQHVDDVVGELLRRPDVARHERVGQHRRRGHPRRQVELRAALVGHQLALGVTDRRDELTGLGAHLLDQEAAVADVQGAVAVAQVAEDVGAALATQRVAELDQRPLQRGVVDRIDRDELPRAGSVCVLGVLGDECRRAVEELEVQAMGDAVVPHGGQHTAAVVQRRRDVDLPALLGQLDVDGVDTEPHAVVGRRPAVGQAAVDRRQQPGGRIRGRGRHVVERGAGEAEALVQIVHDRQGVPRP